MNTLLRSLVRGAVYMGLRRLGLLPALILGALALIALIVVGGARAQTVYSTSCAVAGDPPAAVDQTCEVVAERLEAIETAIREAPAPPTAVSAEVTNWPASSSEPQEVAGVVALSELDRERLDVTWAALWLAFGWAVGIFVFGPLLNREARGWGGGT